MCGITGALDLTGLREFPFKQLLSMTGAIAHRGPDDEYFHCEPGLSLAARRLAIMDIANGRQPMANESETIWSCFNGQVFNYDSLRKNLIAHNHQLKNHCDSELWPHLYEDYGPAMFERTQGQFAVALWDKNNRTLILGRDRMGICPLYYTQVGNWFLWGSEIKSLLASGLIQAEADLKGIDYLFNFFCAANERTCFKNIKLIPPGHFLKIKDGHIEMHQYWDLDFPDAGEEKFLSNPTPLIDEMEALLHKSIQLRLRSDAPIASYLSSGIDSTTILNMSGRVNGKPLPSFSIGLDKKTGHDERAHSAQSAKLIGSDLTTVNLDVNQLSQTFPELILATEGPLLDTSCAAMMELAKEVNKQGYKVVLTGEGADEALAGYFWFKTQKLSGNIKNWIGTMPLDLLRRLMHSSIAIRKRGHTLQKNAVNGIRPAQQYMYESVSLARESFYSNTMWDALDGHNPFTELHIPNESIKRWHPLNQSLYVGYKVMLPGLLMIAKGDRVAMHSSVEARYPFLDEEFTAFCSTLHPSYKLNHMTEKWILRQMAAKTLPLSIAYRPKTMFRATLSNMFLSPNRPAWVDQLLSTESLQRTGYFDPKAVAYERWKHANLPKITPRQHIVDAALTCIVTTQLWHHLFCGGGLCDLPAWEPNIIF